MHVGHDPVVRPDASHAAALDGSEVQRTELPDRVAVPDHELGGLAGVLLVLGNLAQRAERVDPIVAADPGVARDHHMRLDRRARVDPDVGADHAERSDPDFVAQFGARVDQRVRVDARRHQACPAADFGGVR